MKALITMDSTGRIVLPKNIRRSLNLPRTAVFEAEVLGNRLELTPAESQSSYLRHKGKLLVISKQGMPADAVTALEETRADRL